MSRSPDQPKDPPTPSLDPPTAGTSSSSDASLLLKRRRRGSSRPPTPSPKSSSVSPPSPVFTAEKLRTNLFGTLLHALLVYWISITIILLILLTYVEQGFASGFLWGIFISVLFLRYSLAFFLPINRSKLTQDCENLDNNTGLTDQRLAEQLADLASPDKIVYRGWMNVLSGSYDPRTYHLAQVTCALIRLDGEYLRISIPKSSKIGKHSFWTEPRYEPSNFIQQEMYNIVGSKVYLRPRKLARRRWFVRKYPICVYILNKNQVCDKMNVTTSSDSELSASDGSYSDDENPQKSQVAKALSQGVLKKAASTSDIPESPENITDGARKLSTRKSKYSKLYLFARNCREKEHWFHKLRIASGQFSYLKQKSRSVSPDVGSQSDANLKTLKYSQQILDWILYTSVLRQFYDRMSAVEVIEDAEAAADKQNLYNMQLNNQFWKPKDRTDAKLTASKENIVWLNAAFTRVFMDCSRDPFWIKTLKESFEMKLATIKLPFFIETLRLAKLDPGSTAPRIAGIHQPTVNDWGLWFDLDLEYFGDFRLALETKVNLMRLKFGKDLKHPIVREEAPSRYWDDNVPQSPESSEDEADRGVPFSSKDPSKEKQKQGKTFMNLVDKITRNRYFQEATENKYIKKLMQDVSETPFMLLVDFIYLEGTLAVNIPPPPSDRIWYGFRYPPKLSIKARPRVGDRSLSLSHIIDWIENKLITVFEKNLVIPNMDDLVVPLMSGSPLMKKVNL